MQDAKQNACSFFSVAVIRVDAKNRALNVLCTEIYIQREKSFHQIVGLYYLRKLTCQIIVKRFIFVGQKRPRTRWDCGKVVHYATLWVTPFNVQYVSVLLTHVCECF